ncbi:hypothetical protein LSTR_LSTR001148 [Laodelphax striatellus]|uniref:Uncharacterized protein n=1 Tax=Laodelphax striatellus TaxID=195883 RepID=A0A482X182_LAOST|nr:hypothetical protein LSTR_LSTR001148 [Laodelphax striatellus]
MYEGITKALNSSSNDESVVATVITGSGDFYSSGNDIKGYMTDGFDFEKQSQEAATILERFVASFVNHSKILIAVVNGPAIGIAATTLALCDYVIASDKAYFYTPFTSLGLSPEGCSTHTFPRLLGTRKVT